MNFEQMVVCGGKSCLKEGGVFIGSVILSLGTTGFTAGLSWTLAGVAYADYFMCQWGNMGNIVATNNQLTSFTQFTH